MFYPCRYFFLLVEYVFQFIRRSQHNFALAYTNENCLDLFLNLLITFGTNTNIVLYFQEFSFPVYVMLCAVIEAWESSLFYVLLKIFTVWARLTMRCNLLAVSPAVQPRNPLATENLKTVFFI